MFLITVLHITVCFALIIIVLLQAGKGADIGASLGGAGSQTLFGTTGAATMISKVTTGIAIVFMLTSLTLAYSSGKSTGGSLMDKAKPVSTTAAPATVPATDTAPETGTAPAADDKTADGTAAADTPAEETSAADNK